MIFDSDDGELGDWGNAVGQIGSTGLGIGVGLLTQHGQSQGGQQGGLHGSGLIDQMVAEYHAMERAGSSPAELVQYCDAALQVLHDPQYGPWDNEQYHQQGITVFMHAIQVLQAQAGGTPAPTQTVQTVIGPNGQPQQVIVTTPAASSGISTNTLLLIGGGLVAVMLLMNRNDG